MRISVVSSYRVIALIFALLPIAVNVHAQKPQCDADKLLVTETHNSHSSDVIRLSVLSLITKDQFDEMKKSGSAGGSFVVDAIPIKAYANFDDFRRAVTREKRLFQYDLDESRIRGLSRQYLSPTGADAYVRCVDIVSRSISGTHLWFQEVSPNSSTVVVHVRWIGAPGASQTGDITFQIEGGTSARPIPKLWRTTETVPFIFKRDPDKDFVVAASIGGTEGVVALPAPPKLKRVATEAVQSEAITTSSGGNVSKHWHYEQSCFKAEPDWTFNPDSAEIVAKRTNAGERNLPAKIYVRDESRICWDIGAGTGAKETNVKIDARVNVIRRRTLPN